LSPDELIVDRADGIVRLTLNRPERRNALTPELIEALHGALEEIEADASIRAVVVSGAGSAFCAGFDIARIESPGSPGGGAERDLVERLCARLREIPPPVVAKVNGDASGAGCDLAVSCDVRFAATTARMAMPPARLGFLYSWQGTGRLVASIGPAAAKELLFSGELIDAERALAIGLVNRVYPPERLDDETQRYVEAVAANAPLAVAASKLLVNLLTAATPSDETLSRMEEAGRLVWESDDSEEGPRAFRERRPPRFVGR
jgi:enoyl-CoA hydratase/carnithine racemase